MINNCFKQKSKSSKCFDLIKPLLDKRQIGIWKANGANLPLPPCKKQEILKRYGKLFSLKILIETGTYMGDMVWANKNYFDKIISIEIDYELYKLAKKRFSKFNHIEIIHGDSGEILGKTIEKINQPCLFWLDGHFSGGITGKGILETSIIKELEHIYSHHINRHIILIDDARLFNGQKDYPTIAELKNIILNKDCTYEIEEDIIRIIN